MRQGLRAYLAVTVLAWLHVYSAAPVAAEKAVNGFTVTHELTVNAPQARVYESLVEQVGHWWNPDHTFSGDSANLSIDARPGGCFCEVLPHGGGVEHLRVVYIAPGSVLRMSGALGPLQAYGLAGSLTWTLKSDSESSTELKLSYIVGGFMEGGFDQIAPAVEAVLGEQVQRLKHFVETGEPAVAATLSPGDHSAALP